MTALRARLADASGFSMIEVLMAASLMIVVLTAALASFDGFLGNQSTASTRFDAQDRARTTLDRLSRDLRNVTGASTGAAEIDTANAYDLIFRTTNPAGPPNGQNSTNLERVRYCIDTSNPANETLRVMTQTWNISTVPNPPSTGCVAGVEDPNHCPNGNGSAVWCTNTIYADHLTNEVNGQTRPLFSYATLNGAIDAVHTELYLNGLATTTRATNNSASETHLSTGVYLRNQDVPPSAAFSAYPGTGYITLDGSASSDPAGQPLTYIWYEGSCKIGTQVVFNYNVDCSGNPLQSGSSHTVYLKVYDPAGLETDAAAQTVVVQ